MAVAPTLITFLLDRTGSMADIKQSTIDAYNAYLKTLREGAGDSERYTLLQFDSYSVDKTCSDVHPKDAPELNDANYQPRASTPLIDASYETIKAVERKLGDDKTTKVVICIQTDGLENASTVHTFDELNALIKEKIALGWQFNFFGVGIDAYTQAERMGISLASTMAYNPNDAVATASAFVSNAVNTRAFAAGLASDTSYMGAQKLAAGDKFDPGLNPTSPVGVSPTAPPKRKQRIGAGLHSTKVPPIVEKIDL